MDELSQFGYGYGMAPSNDRQNFPPMPWTIEQQLHSYALSKQRTERHEILWISWLQNRRWLSELLEYTVFSAPMYSRHNAAHCESVIHNIECLLGEDEIRRLSATDCFAILVAVYLHDIGMVMTSCDCQDALKSETFGPFIQQMKQSTDPNIRWAAEVFSDPASHYAAQGANTASGGVLHNQRQYDIYRAVVLLLAEYQRKQHADISAKRVAQWIENPGTLQSGLLMTGIPIRIFLQIAACARMHGASSFDVLMKTLPQCDGGYVEDTYHPMFIGVLLSLGDILDLDNERFNPFTRDILGNELFPTTSQMHYRKHQAIRALRITAKSIHIEADCSNSQELRQLCQEMDWLESFLKNCSYHWATIAPSNFCGCLPVVDLARVSLEGRPIPASLVTTKFELSQKKAFGLLSGANLYEHSFPFLREVLQNAVDAVKLQYWADYSASEFREEENLNLCEANRNLPFWKYPVHIDVAVKKRRKASDGTLLDVVKEDLEMPVDDLLREYEFGVEVRVQDCGIGISKEDIQQISKVGSSHGHRLTQISRLPEWLRPTGHFGIGLQSLFLVDNHFSCTTRTRTKECYQMTFYSGEKAEGYINIIPYDVWHPEHGDIPYGTCFSIFVPECHKISHTQYMTGWLGMDPYQDGYAGYRKLRRSIELMVQIEEEINGLIGERLFPIITREQELDSSLPGLAELREKLRQHSEQLPHGKNLKWQLIPANTRRLEREEQAENYCWLFQEKEQASFPCLRDQLSDGSVYYFDVEHGRLYGWSQHAECFFCCSAHRILRPSKFSDQEDDEKKNQNGVRLFIKGLFIKEISCAENDLFEYIDVKNDRLQNHLQMNRDGLTSEGIQILNTEIIPQIQRTFDLILARINENNLKIMLSNREQCLAKFSKICMQGLALHPTSGGRSFDMDSFIKKFQKRLKNMPQAAFAYSSLQPLPDISGDMRESETWQDFWNAASAQFPVYTEDGLRKIFEEEIGVHIKKDLASHLLETVSYKIHHALEKVKGQKSSTLDKATLDQFRQNLTDIHQIVFLCALCFFYANTGKPTCENSCVDHVLPCSWEYLNEGISRILKYADSLVDPMNEFMPEFIEQWKKALFLPSVKEHQSGRLRQDVTIADLMLRGNHYAVYSSRSSRQGHWRHMLIHLQPLYQWATLNGLPKGATVVELINARPNNPQDCRRREDLLNIWHWRTINEIYRAHIGVEAERKPSSVPDTSAWENSTIRWIVRNLPSLSVSSDSSGNTRINVLSFHAPQQLFLNNCMLNLLTDRMRNVYERHNAQRMCTTTWDGLADLCCKDDITTNILRVDRGKVSDANMKSTMLMAFPSELPAQQVCLPNGQTLAEVQVDTVYDLLRLLQRVYTQNGELYDFTYAQDVLNFCKEIAKLLKIDFDGCRTDPPKPEESEGKASSKTIKKQLVKILQEKFEKQKQEELRELRTMPVDEREYAERSIEEDRKFFLEENLKHLHKNMEDSYVGLFSDLYGDTDEPFDVKNSWSQVDLPDDTDRYLNSLLVHLYGFDLKTAKSWKDISDFPIYPDTETFQENARKVYLAACYLFIYANQQYRDEFLENICHWWVTSIWPNDPGQNNFIEYSRNHLMNSPEKHKLLELYQEQIRMLIRAQITALISPIGTVLVELPAFQQIVRPR